MSRGTKLYFYTEISRALNSPLKCCEDLAMDLVIIVALQDELPNLKIDKCKLLFSGVGKVNAAQTTTEAILKFRPRKIVNLGTVGVLSEDKLGSILPVNEVIERDMIAEPLSPRGKVPFEKSDNIFFSRQPGFRCATGDSFVTQPDPWLTSNKVDMVDMELFAIAKVCSIYNVPWFSLKFGTDIANAEAAKHWSGNLKEAQNALSTALLELI